MIIGHSKIWQFLKKSAELEKSPHGLLFFGQAQLGKKTLAQEFIKLLDCEFKDFKNRPCQICRSCQDIQKRQHPDLLVIEPMKKEIQISQIRELSWRLSLRAYSAPFKAAIIDQAHCLNQEAQTSLLKTLEEPKGQALLILITEYPEMLFPTILSRVQKIKFYSVKKEEIKNHLKNQGLSEEESEEITGLSRGRPGIAIDFLKNHQKLEIYKQKIKELTELTSSDLAPRFQYARDLSKEDNLKEILPIWLNYFRDLLIERCSKWHFEHSEYSLTKLKNILQQIQKTNFLISTTNVNPRLALEILLMEL